ncbi:hypothetical protein CDAR_567251 [Caerostris darwini]|uniref:Uncharacterized protein n=1 Tax=Caerostris darwini TaxID=1538125 RepID=A0AAV4QXN9_9ARAC|nr:hypothetical protein CDAR_567251 [Caerostris darwini]
MGVADKPVKFIKFFFKDMHHMMVVPALVRKVKAGEASSALFGWFLWKQNNMRDHVRIITVGLKRDLVLHTLRRWQNTLGRITASPTTISPASSSVTRASRC